MLLIIEGVDRCGKSSLANFLAEYQGFSIYKHKEDNIKYTEMTNKGETHTMLAMLDVLALFPEKDIILDRFHLSDAVYGTMNRNYDEDEVIENLKLLDKRLRELKAKIIYVEPTDDGWSSEQNDGIDCRPTRRLFESFFQYSRPDKVTNYNEIVEASINNKCKAYLEF